MVEEILRQMEMILDEEQLIKLKDVIESVISDCETKAHRGNAQLIQDFVKSKEYENCSKGTIKAYVWAINKLDRYSAKPFTELNKKDIERFLADYKNGSQSKSVSINNIRRNISSFFNFLECEELIQSNPVKKIHPVKVEKELKCPFTEIEIDKIRSAPKSLCDKAIVNTLLCTGVRVSELVSLNISDIQNKEAIVRGKGNKERRVYFSDVAFESLMEYLESRNDDNPALFVTDRLINGKHNRLGKDSVERRIKKLGDELGIVMHPHKFRRTVATKCLNMGMPIQEVQTLLGHTKIETTMIYCSVSDMNIKYNHHKYIA